ncbi:hypothetical protein BX070DRAFT_157494 [Coemansia spiralis]|nr:hypothetical protein BX070DRAFT_157494 [Coemansia spiralis]
MCSLSPLFLSVLIVAKACLFYQVRVAAILTSYIPSAFVSFAFDIASVCRLRRFDLEKMGFQQIYRRASEGHILHQGCPAQHVNEALERKFSLPIIPDIAKLRATSSVSNLPLIPGLSQQPMPKRLRTILEDSVGLCIPDHSATSRNSSSSGNASENSSCNSDYSGDSESKNSTSRNGEANESSEYLIANIGIYLVSAKLSILVCHYENPLQKGLLSAQMHASSSFSPTKSNPLSPSTLPAAQCDCASSALAMADVERIQHLLSQIHKLDTINSARNSLAGVAPFSTGTQHPTAGGESRTIGSNGNSGSNSLASRHVQIYSVGTERLLCAFPEEGYQKVYGKSPADAARNGAGLRSLWEHCQDKKTETHAKTLLQCPNVPNSDPIRLELQVRCGASGQLVDVQSILFRWGNLLFVCQQARGDNARDLCQAGMVTSVDESNALSNYNICTPPSDSPARTGMALELGARQELVSHQYANAGARSTARHQSDMSQPNQPVPPNETRIFSLPRAPASVAANIFNRPSVTLTPPESVPPRRQSSYTLPPAKSFEERRFSYPTQILNGEKRPPTLSISSHQQQQLLPPPHHQHHQPHSLPQTPHTGVGASVSSAPITGISRSSPLTTMTASPGSGRMSDVRLRPAASIYTRSGMSIITKNMGEAPSQPTPAISPMSAGIVQHTPASLSPAPQSQPHSAHPGYVQVNVYPPPEAGGDSWRWVQGQKPVMQPHAQPQQLQSYPPSQKQQHQHKHQAKSLPQQIQQRPAAQPNRAAPSPHAHFAHYTMAEQQYQSPLHRQALSDLQQCIELMWKRRLVKAAEQILALSGEKDQQVTKRFAMRAD